MSLIWDLKTLGELSRHKRPIVRLWACERINHLYGGEGGDILLERLDDSDKDVINEAIQYFIEHPDKRYADPLLMAYRERRGWIGGGLADALSRMKDDRVLLAIEEKSKESPLDPIESAWVIPSITRIGDKGEVRGWLERMLRELPEDEDIEPSFFSSLTKAIVIVDGDISDLLIRTIDHPRSLLPTLLKSILELFGSWYTEEDVLEGKVVIEDSLDYLRGKGYKDIAKRIKGSLDDSGKVANLIYDKANEILKAHGAPTIEIGEDGDIERCYRILRAIKEVSERVRGDKVRGLIITAVILFTILVQLESLIGIKIEDLDVEKALSLFFEDRIGSDYDKRLMDRLLSLYRPSIAERCIEQVKRGEETYGTLRAIRLLGSVREVDAIPYLVNALGSDFLSDEAIPALLNIGPPVIDAISPIFKGFDRDRIIRALYLLSDIPVEEAVDMIIERWDELWIYNKDALLDTVRAIGSKRFISHLRKELREGEIYESEVFYLLCLINGVLDPSLRGLEEYISLEKGKAEKRLEMLVKGEIRQIQNEPIEVELRCLDCKRAYHYKIKDIVIDIDTGTHHIIDTIRCKNCNSIDNYEITIGGRLAIIGNIAFFTMHNKGDEEVLKEGTIKIGKVGLMDGRHMSIKEALSHYETMISRDPKNPEYLLGYANVLRTAKRREESIKFYNDVINIDPLAVEAYASLGQFEVDKGNLKTAYHYFKKANDILDTGHYYKTKDIDSFKEAVFTNLLNIGRDLGIGPSQRDETRVPARGKKVGRNDPCPCGSGKKYKKCCLIKEEEKTTVTYQEQRLVGELLSYSKEKRFNPAFEDAYALFWGRPLDKDVVVFDEGDKTFNLFIEWFIHDYLLPSGRTITEEFYNERFPALSGEEREILETWITSYMDLYEVTSVTPGKGFSLKGLITGRDFDVIDIKGSRSVVKWDIIFARVYSMKETNKVSGGCLIVPRRNRDGLTLYLKKEFRDFSSMTGKDEWPAFMKGKAYLVRHYLDKMQEEMRLITDEGHSVVFSKAVYEAKGLDEILYRLGREYDFEHDSSDKDGHRFTWLKRGRSKEWDTALIPQGGIIFRSEMVDSGRDSRWITLGSITLKGDRLTLESISKERLERGKRRLEEILGDLIIHKVDRYESPESSIGRHGDITDSTPSPKSPHPFIEKEMKRLYYEWLEKEIPALNYTTPREAVNDPLRRERLIELLKDWENIEERKRINGEPYIDLAFLRDELKLDF